jgi:HEXXH motif-containing protein
MTAAVGPVQDYPIVNAETARYFASPELHADAALPHALIGEYASALFELAFERCGPAMADVSSLVFSQATLITGKALPWSAAWNPDLAQIERLLASPLRGHAAWNAVAPMLLRLGAEGVLTEADLALKSPQKLFWGPLRLPEADRVTFQRGEDWAEIRLYTEAEAVATVQAQRDADGLWQSDDAPRVGIVWMCGYPIPVWTPADGRGYPHPSKRPALPDATAQISPVLEEAGELLTQFAPSFVPWVANGMRSIVPLDASAGVHISASVEEFPGLTFLSFPSPAVELAEWLAHEASHHHFLALQRLTPVHDGTDKKEYFSPIKLKGRTIDLTLFAFHAFANAAIYHRNLVRSRPEYYRLNGRTLDESLERIRVLEGYLGETRALTEAGMILWKPLSEALFEG